MLYEIRVRNSRHRNNSELRLHHYLCTVTTCFMTAITSTVTLSGVMSCRAESCHAERDHVMLSAAKHLSAQGERPFASLRVTCSC